jgi:hypothetical protein
LAVSKQGYLFLGCYGPLITAFFLIVRLLESLGCSSALGGRFSVSTATS